MCSHFFSNIFSSFSGGSDRNYAPVVSCLRPGSIAHRCDQVNKFKLFTYLFIYLQLQVGERLIAVGGIKVASLTHSEILTVLRSAGNTVRLEVEYDLNDPCKCVFVTF